VSREAGPAGDIATAGPSAWKPLTAVLLGMSLLHIVAIAAALPSAIGARVHVGCVLVAVFLAYPAATGARRPAWFDIVCAVLAVATIAYAVAGSDAAGHANPLRPSDAFFGALCTLLVMEAFRRTAGWPALLVVAGVAAIAAMSGGTGGALPGIASGDVQGLIARLFQTREGLFGALANASATLVVPLSILAALVHAAGADAELGRWSRATVAALRRAPAQAVVLLSALLGGLYGAPRATAEGSAPLAARLRDVGADDAGDAAGLREAAASGAILSPPVLGAAAILAGAFLHLRYVDLLALTVVPAALVYGTLALMVALAARRHAPSRPAGDAPSSPPPSPTRCALALAAPGAFVALLVAGVETRFALLGAMLVGVLSLLLAWGAARGMRMIGPALAAGSRRVLAVAAACVAGGIVVVVGDATGAPQRMAEALAAAAAGSLLLAVLYAAILVRVAGLVLPKTMNFVVCAVFVAPALGRFGISDTVASMFVLLGVVLSARVPGRAPLRDAAVADGGGNVRRTILRSSWYLLPAMVIPFVLVLDPSGAALLLAPGPEASWSRIAWMACTTALGIVAIAAGLQGWLVKSCGTLERWLLCASGILLAAPAAAAAGIGLAGLGAVAARQWLLQRRAQGA
jgi:TRAP-type uncharacterized transport system fused permease subunit